MKKFILCLGIIFLIVPICFGADSKLSDLTELATTPADSDEFYINDGGVPKKIQYSNLTGNKLNIADIDDVAVDSETNAPISSNWAYDHENDTALHLPSDHATLVAVRNTSGAQIDAGKFVYVSGATGQKMLIGLADNTSYSTSHTVGYVYSAIANNANGYVMISGMATGQSTAAWGFSDGDELYIGTSGDPVNAQPTDAVAVPIGYLVYSNAGAGIVFVSADHPLTGVDETYSSGWASDPGTAEKDDIYDYLHQIDTDDDGSLIDESWFNLYNVGNPSTSKTFSLGSYSLQWTLGSNGHHKLGGDTDDYFEIYEDGSGNFIFRIVDAGSDGNIYMQLDSLTITDEQAGMQTGTSAGDYFTIDAYDDDGAARQEMMRFTNANDPTVTMGSSTNNVSISAAGVQVANGATNFSNSEVTDGHFSTLIHKTWSFDPDAVCDGDVDRLFLMTVGDEAASGIIIDEWKVSFEADPTTEADLDLKYADAFIGVANAAVIDVLDTTAGVASEDTDANINSGSAVANGKVMYLEFGTAYTETGHQVIVELWYHAD